MQFRVSHEVLFEVILDASGEKEAEELALAIPYADWIERCIVREACVALEESPLNPFPE